MVYFLIIFQVQLNACFFLLINLEKILLKFIRRVDHIIHTILTFQQFHVHPNDSSSSLKTRRLITVVYLLHCRRPSLLCSAFEGCRYVAENIDPTAPALATPLALFLTPTADRERSVWMQWGRRLVDVVVVGGGLVVDEADATLTEQCCSIIMAIKTVRRCFPALLRSR